MRLPILVLLLGLLGGCAAGAGTPPMMTDEARCRQQGGVWRTANDYCESGSGGGGY